MGLFAQVEFWQAISAFAWPIAAIVIALIFRRFAAALVNRDKLTIKVAGMEISVAEATEQAGKGLSDLQERLAALEQRAPGAPRENAPVDDTDRSTGQQPVKGEKSILWVDDYPSNNAFIIEKLESDGIRVRKELSTDAAMAALRSDRFDVLISDLGRIEAGKENPFAGLELARAMSAESITVPMLVFSGPRGMENRERLRAAGVDHVTASPVDVFKFIDQHLRAG